MLLIDGSHPGGIVSEILGPESAAIHVTRADGTTTVAVSGEIDLSNSDRLSECLRHAMNDSHVRIDVDLEGLSYMDSTGLAVLLGAQARLHEAGGTMRLIAPRPAVATLLRVTGRVTCPIVEKPLRAARRMTRGDRPG